MRFLKTGIIVLGLAVMFLSLPGRAQERFILHVKSSEEVDIPMGGTPAWATWLSQKVKQLAIA